MRQLLTLALALTLLAPLTSSAQTTNCTVTKDLFTQGLPFLIIDAPTGCPIPKDDGSNISLTKSGSYLCTSDNKTYTDISTIISHNGVGFYALCSGAGLITKSTFKIAITFGGSPGSGSTQPQSGYYCNRTDPVKPYCTLGTGAANEVPYMQCMTSCVAPENRELKIVTDLNSTSPNALPWADEGGRPIFEVGQEIGFWADHNFSNVRRYSWNFDDKIKGVSPVKEYPDSIIYSNSGFKNIKLDLLDVYNNLLASTSSVINIIPKLWVKTYADNKLLNLQGDTTFPINKVVTFQVNSNVNQVFPGAKEIWTSWTIKKIGSNQQNFTQEKTNLYFNQPFKFIFKSPGKYEITAIVKGFYPPQVSEVRPMFIVPEKTYINASCDSSIWDSYKVKKTINSLINGEVVDINTDNLEQWIKRDNPKIISSMIELQQTCSSISLNKIVGRDIFQQFKNDPPNNKPVNIAIQNNKLNGHALIAVDFKKDTNNLDGSYKIGVIDPNLPQQINYLESCQYKKDPSLSSEFFSLYLDQAGGGVICNYPYKPWSDYGSSVAVIIEKTDVTSNLLKNVYNYCVSNDFVPYLCNRYGDFGSWLKNSLPLSLKNFNVSLPGSELGNCAGWTEVILRATYLGNFVGGGSCSVARSSDLQVGAVGLSDIWTYFIKLGEWFKLPTSN